MVAAKIRIVLGGSKTMNCADFQRDLPEFMEGGSATADAAAHLKQCSICSDLVEDLKYIAEAAKLLVPMHDPSPQVWEGIERSLRHERTSTPLRSAGGPGRVDPFLVPAQRSHLLTWSAVAVAAVLILALISYQAISHSNVQPSASAVVTQPSSDNDLEPADQQLLTEISSHRPAMRAAYEQSIRNVNAYIRDAQKAAKANPGDPDANSHLMNAYEQKAALYEMASTSP